MEHKRSRIRGHERNDYKGWRENKKKWNVKELKQSIGEIKEKQMGK